MTRRSWSMLAGLRGCESSIVIIHVADGWVARNIPQLDLREFEEMKEDPVYSELLATRLQAQGLAAEAQ